MKLIDKNNIFTVFCRVFTVMALFGTTVDMISRQEVNYTQFNICMIAAGSLIGVLVLSQFYRLESRGMSPLKSLLVLYAAALAIVFMSIWVVSRWFPVDPGGYLDVFVTFSVPYLIGSAIYLFYLKKETRRQNEDIQLIRSLSRKQK